MPKYRKKPVEIEAVQFTRETFEEVVRFTNGKASDLRIPRNPDVKAMCVIPTLEGNHIAREGDYIIKGVRGEFYPCRPDIFAETYEEATINPESLRPKGEWIAHNNDGLPYSDEYECPICGIYCYDSTNFCSHCGADMRARESRNV